MYSKEVWDMIQVFGMLGIVMLFASAILINAWVDSKLIHTESYDEGETEPMETRKKLSFLFGALGALSLIIAGLFLVL